MLQQALTRDIFNPSAPAQGWTVVRSSISAFSLGGGCGRSNLLDFPFINGSRPEILRITGTTATVITLGISNSDQYDSVDCATGSDGRALYMLTNRTRRTLELRREQGGMLVLVRDDFGVVATPFRGGQRPGMRLFRRPVAVAPLVASRSKTTLGAIPSFDWKFLYETINDAIFRLEMRTIVDAFLTDIRAHCGALADRPDPGAFNGPKEPGFSSGVAVGDVEGKNTLSLREYSENTVDCSVQPPQSLGSAGPFGLFSWATVVVNESAPGPLFHTTVIVPGTVITIEGNQQRVTTNPFGTRGGPISSCLMSGSELESAQLASGVGPTANQVQQSMIPINLQEQIFSSSVEEFWSATTYCAPPQ